MTSGTLARLDSARIVDRASPLPVYFQIANDIRRRIASGQWPAGQRIAPELTLATDYDVSRVTIRQALAELVKDDLVDRRPGSGTYVREHRRPLVYDLDLTVGALANRWRDADFDNRADVIERGTLAAPSERLRRRLRVSDTGAVVYLVRRILINDEPTALHRSWLRADLVPGIESSSRLGGSLSAVLAEDYGFTPTRTDYEVGVVRSTQEEASLLGAPSDVPLVVLTSTSYLADDAPLEHSQLAWLGDRVRFHVTARDPGAIGR